MVFSDENTIFTISHKYTQNTVICIEELKSMHLKYNLFAFVVVVVVLVIAVTCVVSFSSLSAEYLQKFEFLLFEVV